MTLDDFIKEKVNEFIDDISIATTDPDKETGIVYSLGVHEDCADANALGDAMKEAIIEAHRNALKQALEACGEDKKANGKLTIDGREVGLKLHSDIAVGYNTAKQEDREAIKKLL